MSDIKILTQEDKKKLGEPVAKEIMPVSQDANMAKFYEMHKVTNTYEKPAKENAGFFADFDSDFFKVGTEEEKIKDDAAEDDVFDFGDDEV